MSLRGCWILYWAISVFWRLVFSLGGHQAQEMLRVYCTLIFLGTCIFCLFLCCASFVGHTVERETASLQSLGSRQRDNFLLILGSRQRDKFLPILGSRQRDKFLPILGSRQRDKFLPIFRSIQRDNFLPILGSRQRNNFPPNLGSRQRDNFQPILRS